VDKRIQEVQRIKNNHIQLLLFDSSAKTMFPSLMDFQLGANPNPHRLQFVMQNVTERGQMTQ